MSSLIVLASVSASADIVAQVDFFRDVGKVNPALHSSDQVIDLDVKGLGNVKRVAASVLDHTRDDLPCACDFADGRLRLVKSDKYSAAFFVTFD